MSNKLSKPIVCKISDNEEELSRLYKRLEGTEFEKYIKNFPTVYIHSFSNIGQPTYDVYIGESNDLYSRTQQHYNKGKTDKEY